MYMYMQHFKALAMESARFKPIIWFCYVDDTFVIWNEGRDKLHDFLDTQTQSGPASVHKGTGGNRKLPFLDVIVARGGDKLITTVYKNKTHTDRYIHYI